MSDWIKNLKNSSNTDDFIYSIGDRVQVVDSGWSYPYDSIARLFKLTQFIKLVPDGVVCHVIGKQTHPNFDDILIYAIEDQDGDQYVVEENGLQSV